ncbi:hypothetical protein K439DRAFT_1613985 [Ramaria rubella]|nr:hypothetical protein K439DRAFT_1613985 [Ramaria rubella]
MPSNERVALPINSPLSDSVEPQHMQAEATQYKERFFALQERYERVSAIHRDHETAFETAQTKLKSLQAECDMLLDSIATHVPSQPTLLYWLDQVQGPRPAPHPDHMSISTNGGSAASHHNHVLPHSPVNGHEPHPSHMLMRDAR